MGSRRPFARSGSGTRRWTPRYAVASARGCSPFGLREDAIILGYGLSECGPVVGGSRHFRFDAAGPRPYRSCSTGRPAVIPFESSVNEARSFLKATSARWMSGARPWPSDTTATRKAQRCFSPPMAGFGPATSACSVTVNSPSPARVKETTTSNREVLLRRDRAVARSTPAVESAFAVPCRRNTRTAGQLSAPFALFFVAPSLRRPAGRVATRLRRAISGRFGFAPAHLSRSPSRR